jgi:hypothetical protein
MMTIRFLAVIFTGCALIAPGAHLFELPRKLRMSEDHYYIVQNIYLGWWGRACSCRPPLPLI